MSPRVLVGHRYIATNLPRGLTAECEAQAFWEVLGHYHWEVSEFLGFLNSISCILRGTSSSSDLAVPQESTLDTVSEDTCVEHQVYKL